MTAKIDGFDFSEASAPRKETPMKKKMTDSEMERIVSADLNRALGGLSLRSLTAPRKKAQKKAPMKTPRRTKAPLSSSEPSLQRKAKASKAKKKGFATLAEQTLLAAVVKYGNNYQLAKLAGTTPDILSRFARQERTLRLDTAGQVAAALGIRFQ